MVNTRDISEILNKAKEEGEVYLTSLTPEQLKKTNFEEEEDFFNFDHVDIYILYDGDGFKLKYVFDDDWSNTLYESENDAGGEKYFIEVIKEYLQVAEE